LAIKSYERFRVYRIGIDYPAGCRVEFKAKSRREAGDVVFHFPEHETISLSWGPLERALKSFATAEQQAEHSLEAVKKDRHAKSVDKIAGDAFEVNSHTASYNHIKVEEILSSVFLGKKKVDRQALTLHLHCEPTARYFVIYSMLTPHAPSDFKDVFLEMARSLRCH
jgi:hypothetical protein